MIFYIVHRVFSVTIFHSFSTIRERVHGLPKTKKMFFVLFFVIFLFSGIGSINAISNYFSVEKPAYGGTIREGILGTPRFINPVLANSDVDHDMTALIYSGLVRKISDKNGTIIIPDLAESFTISDDGKVYTFTLKDKIYFHDRKPITAEDVIFTITTIQNSQFSSSLLNDWIGVAATSPDEKTVVITLPRPYSGFLETATVGILPKHIWGRLTHDEFVASDTNVIPVGSGPFRVADIKRNKTGTAVRYTLKSFKRFALQKPFIKDFEIVLYPNEQELFAGYERKEFNLLANIRPYEITEQNTLITKTSSLPRVFGLFINTEHSLLQDQKLQTILRKAINTQEIADNVFQGFAQPYNSETDTQAELSSSLDALGWKINPNTSIREKSGKPLSWSISTADTPELKYTAQIIQKQLKSLGIEIELKVFQLSDLETMVIKNKSFDMLLFGQFIKNDADRYAFWHSSQKNISDLNITRYTDQKLDSLLEKLLTLPYTSPERTIVLQSINERISLAPVIWLYQPQFIYASNTPIYQLTIDGLVTRDNRFQQVYQWFVKTDTVWKWFTR